MLNFGLIFADKEWSTYGYKLKRSSTFLETVAAFEEHAESHAPVGGGAPSSSKPGIEEAAEAVASLSKRLGRRRDSQGTYLFTLVLLVGANFKMFRVSGGGWFRWKLNSLFLLVAIGFLVNRDLQKHGGSFVKSSTGVFLTDVGLYEPVMRTIDYGAKAYDAGYDWAEKRNLPGYACPSNFLCHLSNVLQRQVRSRGQEKGRSLRGQIGGICETWTRFGKGDRVRPPGKGTFLNSKQ